MLLELAATLACLCAPDQFFGPWCDEPQAAGGEDVRAVVANDDDHQRVAALMDRQDRFLLDHRKDLARADFADDFCSPDWNCASADELLDRWDDYLHAHKDVAIRSTVGVVHRVGKNLVAAVERNFRGTCFATDAAVDETSTETLVLRDQDGALKISACFETATAHANRFDGATHRYDRRSDLCYTLTWPEPFVPVPRDGPGAAIDHALFLDPEDDAVLGVMVFDPTLQLELAQLMAGDLIDENAEWNREPRRFEHAPAGFGEALEAEVHYPEDPRKGAMGRERLERAIYLSPDHRMVFAFWIAAPPATFFRVKSKVDELARSVRLANVRAGRPYWQALFEQNPRWRTVVDGIFRSDAVPIELPIPEDFEAVPLVGDHILRMRLELKSDPGTSLILRVFPPGEDRISAGRILEKSVQRMLDLACAESQGDSARTQGTMDVLGRHGDMNGVEIACRDGTRRAYEIVAVDCEECHVQVQLMPRSERRALHETALKKVLAALRVRK